MTYSRRDLCLLVAALAASPGVAAQKTAFRARHFPTKKCRYERRTRNETRPVLSGELHDGCYLEVHQTRLAPGGMPHPPHHHLHEEMFLVREGTIEVTISGQSTRLGPRLGGLSWGRTTNTESATSAQLPQSILWSRSARTPSHPPILDLRFWIGNTRKPSLRIQNLESKIRKPWASAPAPREFWLPDIRNRKARRQNTSHTRPYQSARGR